MDIITKDIHLNTKGFSDIHNLTPKVDSIVKETGFSDGFCHFHGIRDGQCNLGTRQQILVLEHDNQSWKSHVVVQVVGK